jgi:hypothetical protein
MIKYTDKDLFEFVYRADTVKKICIAEKWLTEHRELTSKNTFDELIMILNRTAGRIFRVQMAELDEKLYGENVEIDVRTGEVRAGT